MHLINNITYRKLDVDSLDNKKHYHNDTFEIIQLINGTGNYLIDNNFYPMEYGAIYIIDAETFHCSLPHNPKIYCRNIVSFNKSNLSEILGLVGNVSEVNKITPGAYYLSGQAIHAADNLFLELSKCYENKDHLQVLLNLLNILVICRNYEDKIERGQTPNLVEQTISYIQEHMERHLTIKEISNSLHISPSSLCHIIKSQTQMSVMNFVLVNKITHSVRLLRTTNMSIDDIARKCGFNSHSNFCVNFKKQMGVSPMEYRKRIK